MLKLHDGNSYCIIPRMIFSVFVIVISRRAKSLHNIWSTVIFKNLYEIINKMTLLMNLSQFLNILLPYKLFVAEERTYVHILKNRFSCSCPLYLLHSWNHGLGTPSEGINQINLRIWADVADKICFSRT